MARVKDDLDTPERTDKDRRNLPPLMSMWALLFIVGLAVLLFLFIKDDYPGVDRIEYGMFKRELAKDNIKFVRQTSNSLLVGEFIDFSRLHSKLREARKDSQSLNFTVIRTEDKELIKQLEASQAQGKLEGFNFDRESSSAGMTFFLYVIFPLLIMAGIVFFLFPKIRDPMGGGFLSNYIKSPARKYEKGKTRVTFDDVAGMENAKSELREVVEFLKNPEKFHRLGGQIPKGVLLVGPPGTGKTLIARAVAGEAGVPFYSISGSEFIQMFVGVGASRVRDLFKTARENSPCILFVDEIDAVGRVRGAGLGGGHDEREQTLNQILTEMDGFSPTESVIILAATNRPDVLDPALLRPGRFDRHVTIDRPTWQGRLAILKVHTRDKPLGADVNLEQIARSSIGMTGADIRNLCNEAALLATRAGRNKILRRDFEDAADRVIIGAKREEVLTAEEKKRTAYHEAGHAICAYYQPKCDPLRKVTIIPRGRALGVTISQPDEDKMEYNQGQLQARLIMAMGGRAADQMVFQETTSGAAQDLKQATRIARMMVTQFGMSDKLGPVAYRIGEEHVFLGKEISEPRDFSEGTMELIDEEVRRILREADQNATSLLQRHRKEMELLVEALLQREELSKEEVDILFKAGDIKALPPIVVDEPVPAMEEPPPAKATEKEPKSGFSGMAMPVPS